MEKVFGFEIIKGAQLPPVSGRGNKKGSGRNLWLLAAMEEGDCIWDVPPRKCASITQSALRAGIKIEVRKLPYGRNYAIQKKS